MSRTPTFPPNNQSPPAHPTSPSGIDRILRVSDVRAATGLGRNTIYSWIKDGDFPAPVSLGGKRVGWRQSAVIAWIESRPVAKSIRISRDATPWQPKPTDVGR